jgi:hypothetical protein
VRRAGFAFVDEAWLLETASAATTPRAATAVSNPIWIRLGIDGMLPLLILPPFEGASRRVSRNYPRITAKKRCVDGLTFSDVPSS